ncbi:MAG: urease accessory UreF family protein [Nitrospira sp.]
MTTSHLSSRALLSLLQWSDTLFPSGAFSHSFGLESAVQSGEVKDGTDLLSWIRIKMTHQIFPCDLILLSQTHHAAESGTPDKPEKVFQLDAIGYAIRLPKELREGGSMIASRFIQTAEELYPGPWIQSWRTFLSEGKIKGDPTVAFGLVSVGAGIPVLPTLLAYLYTFTSGQVSAALRLLPIGQMEGQRIIHSVLDWAEKSGKISEAINHPDREVSAFMPAAEIGSMQHERSGMRLFQS